MPIEGLLLEPVGLETAPEGSKPFLENIEKSFPFIPNLFGLFANAPALLEGYLALSAAYGKATLNADERELVLLAASVENSCDYCIAAHSKVLKTTLHSPANIIDSVRSKTELPDEKANALVSLTKEPVAERGHLRAETVKAFLAAGYRQDQILEVLVGLSLKTMSNYAHHLSPVAIDPAFQTDRG